MAQSINSVTLSGNLTRDAELVEGRTGGSAILNFGIAVNDRRKNSQTDEWEDYPNFIDCTIFGARAEKLVNYMKKGTKIALSGKLRWSQWERDGQKRSKVTVIANEIEFLSRRNDGDGGGYEPQQSAAPQPQASQSNDFEDEDVPF